MTLQHFIQATFSGTDNLVAHTSVDTGLIFYKRDFVEILLIKIQLVQAEILGPRP